MIAKNDRSYAVSPQDRLASARRGAQRIRAVYYVEGVPLTADQVTERLGLTKKQALARIHRERGAGRPKLTWAALEKGRAS